MARSFLAKAKCSTHFTVFSGNPTPQEHLAGQVSKGLIRKLRRRQRKNRNAFSLTVEATVPSVKS